MRANDVFMAQARAPRLKVLANGVPMRGVIDADVTSNNHYAADRFRLSVTQSADPLGVAILAGADDILIDVQAALDGGGVWRSVIQGGVDGVELDPVNGVLHLHGRDLSARLIETRTQESFVNQTASEIATTLAARHGLDADVMATTTPAGRYWQLEHDRIVLNEFASATTEWDLLTSLARYEGFDLWVSGSTLHFRPVEAVTGPDAVLRPVATGAGVANVTGLRLERALTLARDLQVTVKSWHSRQGRAFTQTARKGGVRHKSGQVLTYVYVVPNLSPDEALKYAQARLAELTRHERVITADMPGELGLAPRMMVRVEGTFTDFDQTYWIDRVERRLSLANGFTQTVHARNASETNQSTSPADKVISVWTDS